MGWFTKKLIVLHSLNSQYNTHVVWIKQSFGHSVDIKNLPYAVYFFLVLQGLNSCGIKYLYIGGEVCEQTM